VQLLATLRRSGRYPSTYIEQDKLEFPPVVAQPGWPSHTRTSTAPRRGRLAGARPNRGGAGRPAARRSNAEGSAGRRVARLGFIDPARASRTSWRASDRHTAVDGTPYSRSPGTPSATNQVFPCPDNARGKALVRCHRRAQRSACLPEGLSKIVMTLTSAGPSPSRPCRGGCVPSTGT
jgi:hypothetical protein